MVTGSIAALGSWPLAEAGLLAGVVSTAVAAASAGADGADGAEVGAGLSQGSGTVRVNLSPPYVR